MHSKIALLLAEIRELEDELEREFAARRAQLRFGIEAGRVAFEQELLVRHRAMQVRLHSYVAGANPLSAITAPVIYGMILPLLLLDLAVNVYQAVCFRAYGIARVRRRDYLVFDRRHLAYLNALEKLNCAYCSYAVGLFAFVTEVGARTEQYWCPIKHARRVAGMHAHYAGFVDYGDAEAFQRDREEFRRRLREAPRA
ncbi:MAG: hypothetical protein JNK67_04435 [Alphaproteobacteria bacterium]|nr:hypothetical protein [Alphaproteobacteria bacterium]